MKAGWSAVHRCSNSEALQLPQKDGTSRMVDEAAGVPRRASFHSILQITSEARLTAAKAHHKELGSPHEDWCQPATLAHEQPKSEKVCRAQAQMERACVQRGMRCKHTARRSSRHHVAQLTLQWERPPDTREGYPARPTVTHIAATREMHQAGQASCPVTKGTSAGESCAAA